MPLPGLDLSDPVHLGIICNAEGDTGHPNTRDSVMLTYARYHVMPILRERWAWLVPLLGLTSSSSIALLGCAYGYSLEVLAEMGITRVIGTEPTAGLRTKLTQPEDTELRAAIEAYGLSTTSGEGLALFNKVCERPGVARSAKAADVLNEDLATNASRLRLRQALQAKGGASWDVITENVLTVLTDDECIALSGFIHQLANVDRVVHVVSTTLPDDANRPGYNWKTLAQWKALIPADTFVSIYSRTLA